MSYDGLITEHKKEANFESLQKDLNKVEAFIDKCIKFVCESSSSVAERDFNVSSL
jgi:hypothetical protein